MDGNGVLGFLVLELVWPWRWRNLGKEMKLLGGFYRGKDGVFAICAA